MSSVTEHNIFSTPILSPERQLYRVAELNLSEGTRDNKIARITQRIQELQRASTELATMLGKYLAATEEELDSMKPKGTVLTCPDIGITPDAPDHLRI